MAYDAKSGMRLKLWINIGKVVLTSEEQVTPSQVLLCEPGLKPCSEVDCLFRCSEQAKLIPAIQSAQAQGYGLMHDQDVRQSGSILHHIGLLEAAGGTAEAIRFLLDRLSSIAKITIQSGELP